MKIRHPEKVNKPINPLKKKPSWIKSKLTNSQEFFLTKSIVNQYKLKTVCQEANCPNITECWSKRHATFLTAEEIFSGSKGSSDFGLPVITSQKAHALVHVSPIIKKVACLLLQHSVIFGQFASWQTVFNLC